MGVELNESDRVDRMGMIAKAMTSPETLVIRMVYRDQKGRRFRRTVSPIRFIGDDIVSALCLCREEPRSFKIANIEEIELVDADKVLMPVEIEELPC